MYADDHKDKGEKHPRGCIGTKSVSYIKKEAQGKSQEHYSSVCFDMEDALCSMPEREIVISNGEQQHLLTLLNVDRA